MGVEDFAAIVDYWYRHYVDKGLCTLCGNTGVIDTTGRAISAASVEVGRRNYCICPNGQCLRLAEETWP